MVGTFLLLLCFFLSGLAGLIYQTAWTRQFSFVFGTSSLAISTVLAAYMAGLAAGAAVAARVAHRITRPILAYGVLELGIAAAALGLPLAIDGTRGLYVAWFGGHAALPSSGGLAPGLFYTVCSFAILMVPTSMMGATLPLLARHAVRSDAQIAGRVGALYAANTAGAVAGTLVAAYALLPGYGLRSTIWVAAGVNALVFLAAWGLARNAGPVPAVRAVPHAGSAGRWILPLVFASGVASFSYEVLWVRLLEHVLGPSVYAFAAMLAAFLTGIAAGSALASRLAPTPARAGLGFVLAQLGAAALSLAAFVVVDRIPELAEALQRSGRTRLFADAVVSMLTLFPAAVCIGATFPTAVRLLARDGSDAGPASARVYSWNTLGSIVGALGTGFFAIPLLGFVGTIVACALLNLALAAAAGFAQRPARRWLSATALIGALGVVWLQPPMPWTVLRYGLRHEASKTGEVVYFGAGRSATVALVESSARWRLTTNGLLEAVIDPPGVWHGYFTPARWLSLLPVLARPDLDSVLVVGLGGGLTVESVPPSVAHITVVELEPEVVAANRAVADRRWRDPLADARVSLHTGDARNALLLSDARYGAIVSQPSHPWAGGAANLYTREFFELVRSRLTDDGVFVQWVGLSFIDPPLFESLLATLTGVFESVRVYSPPPRNAALFIASRTPLRIEATAARGIAANRERFAEIGIEIPEDATAYLLLDEAGTRRFGRDAPENRDDHNRLQSEAPRVGRETRLLGRLEDVFGALDPLARLEPGQGDPFLILDRIGTRRIERLTGRGSASQRMRGLRDPADRAVARAVATLAGGDPAAARRMLVEALEGAPRHTHGRAELLKLDWKVLSADAGVSPSLAAPLDPAEAAVVRGWRAPAASGALAAELDAALAAVSARHPLYREATRLRIESRIASGDPERGREAVALTDRIQRWNPGHLLLRARACLAARDYVATLDTLDRLADYLRVAPGALPDVARSAAELVRAVPPLPELERLRRIVETGLRGS